LVLGLWHGRGCGKGPKGNAGTRRSPDRGRREKLVSFDYEFNPLPLTDPGFAALIAMRKKLPPDGAAAYRAGCQPKTFKL